MLIIFCYLNSFLYPSHHHTHNLPALYQCPPSPLCPFVRFCPCVCLTESNIRCRECNQTTLERAFNRREGKVFLSFYCTSHCDNKHAFDTKAPTCTVWDAEECFRAGFYCTVTSLEDSCLYEDHFHICFVRKWFHHTKHQWAAWWIKHGCASPLSCSPDSLSFQTAEMHVYGSRLHTAIQDSCFDMFCRMVNCKCSNMLNLL